MIKTSGPHDNHMIKKTSCMTSCPANVLKLHDVILIQITQERNSKRLQNIVDILDYSYYSEHGTINCTIDLYLVT